ncbi:SGNH/GDSL hydrolase family protein [Chromobacterium haemolyticum]|uniref:SGNH/GDSL hydrolase family protein n=1 Tax=Chromobacterium TaxID=535 RepID=UPI004057C3F1
MIARSAIRQALAILGSSMLLLCWIEQTSINAYWRQTFHRPSQLEALSELSVWRLGAELGREFRDQSRGLLTRLDRWDDEMIAYFNACCLRPALSPEAAPAEPVAARTTAVVPSAPPVQPLPSPSAPPPQAAAKDPRILLRPGSKVLLAGDSMMQGVAPHLLRPLFKLHQIKALDLSKQSTGLTYPDFFNWPDTIERQLAANPDTGLVVVFLGANDTWDMVGGSRYIRFASEEWEQRYRERIRAILASARKHRTQLLWLGAPNMGKDKLNRGVHYINGIFREEVEGAGQRYLSTREALGSVDEAFTKFMTLPDQGEVAVRTADGIHFTRQGQVLLARRVLAELRFE